MRRALGALAAVGLAAGLSACGGQESNEISTEEAVGAINEAVFDGDAEDSDIRDLMKAVCDVLQESESSGVPAEDAIDVVYRAVATGASAASDLADTLVIVRNSLWSTCPDLADYISTAE